MKKWWCFPFDWMVDVVHQGAWVLYCINWDKGDESQCCQWNFSEIFKGKSIILEPCRDSKYPIRCNLSHQVQSERRRIQNPFKHPRGSVLALVVNGLKLLTGQQKQFIFDVWRGPEYLYTEKQDKCKKNSRTAFCFWLFLQKAPS